MDWKYLPIFPQSASNFAPHVDALYAYLVAVSAFFSIAINIQQRKIQTDLNARDNLADSALRITVGAIGAGVLFCLLQSGLLPMSALGAGAAGQGMVWQVLLVIGFLAGFTERLVPNIFDKMANTAAPELPSNQLGSSDSKN